MTTVDELEVRVDALSKKVDALLEVPLYPVTGPEPAIPTASLTGPTIVSDPALARSTPCLRAELPAGTVIYSKGVLGPLDPESQAVYCTEGYQDATPEQVERLTAFASSAANCAVEVATAPDPVTHLAGFLSCLELEIQGKGLDF